jgi:hypothetical protein
LKKIFNYFLKIFLNPEVIFLAKAAILINWGLSIFLTIITIVKIKKARKLKNSKYFKNSLNFILKILF